MKKLYVSLASFLVSYVRLPLTVRDVFIWPLASRILGYEYIEPLKLKAGFSIHAYMEDHLGRLAIFYGKRYPYFWEPITTQLVERLSKDAHEVLIAGSHVGLTVLYARHAMEDTKGTVHTFEPIAHLHELSDKNIKLNAQLGNMKLSKAALSDSEGFATMTQNRIRSRIVVDTNLTGKETGMETEQVPVTTIGTYCLEQSIRKLDFMLLDVEGYELHAFHGMERLFETDPPKDIIYEVIRSQDDTTALAARIEDFLKQFGYSFYIIDDLDDVIALTGKTTPPRISLIPATNGTYAIQSRHRYFNVYATLRSSSEVEALIA